MSLMPSDINKPDKVIGGYFTYSQLFWVVLGIVVGVCVGAVVSMILGNEVGKVFGFFALFSGIPFAFYRPYKMTYLDYLASNYKFKKKKKQLTKY